MNHLDIAFAARAFAAARAVRSSTVRHRRLVPKPIGVVLWQLGAEPFSAAAIGWGESHAQPHMAVAGEPRNRDLAFAALLDFAKWFNPRFEAHYADRETLTRGKSTITVARTAPQIVVANLATVELLGRLGRRLAYLPTDGPRPADPALVRLGRHLRFLWDHCSTPGQQLVVAMTDLMNAHWATPSRRLNGSPFPPWTPSSSHPPASQVLMQPLLLRSAQSARHLTGTMKIALCPWWSGSTSIGRIAPTGPWSAPSWPRSPTTTDRSCVELGIYSGGAGSVKPSSPKPDQQPDGGMRIGKPTPGTSTGSIATGCAERDRPHARLR